MLRDHTSSIFYSHHKKLRKHTANNDSSRECDTHPDGADVIVDEQEDDAALQFVLQLEEPLQELVQDDVNSKRLITLQHV